MVETATEPQEPTKPQTATKTVKPKRKVHKPWARKAQSLDLGASCQCWDHLREVGITPDRNASLEHRTDFAKQTHNTHDGSISGRTGE